METDFEANFLKARKAVTDAQKAYDDAAAKTADAERTLTRAKAELTIADKALAEFHRQAPTTAAKLEISHGETN